MDAATAITADAAADLFSVLPDVRAEKAPGADQPPRGFFSPEFSFNETVSVSVLLFPAFPSLLFFLFCYSESVSETDIHLQKQEHFHPNCTFLH